MKVNPHSQQDACSESAIVEEIEEDYEPTENEISEYALYLGIDAKEDWDLLWVAREGLRASVPEPWKPCRSSEGNIYYFNFETGQSIWEHPLDQHYRELYQKEKAKKVEECEHKLKQEIQVIALIPTRIWK